MNTHKMNTNNVSYTIAKKKKFDSDSFSQQKVTFDDTPLFFPDGFEKIFLLIYFVSLPYITGLLFLFFYVAEGRQELFLSLNEESSFLMSWAIGYEILAVLILLYIIKSAISFSSSLSRKNKKIQRP